MERVCQGPNVVKGIDVSHWQRDVHWANAKKAGIDFCFIKASEGLKIDTLYKDHKAGAKAQGILTGSYHFFRPERDPLTQAKLFVAHAGIDDLPKVIDWEISSSQIAKKDAVAHAWAFLNEVEKLDGSIPIIYTGAYFFEALGTGRMLFKKFRLWTANWTSLCPLVPTPFDTWQFWQQRSTLTLPGTTGFLDQDVFNGDIKALKTLK